MQLNIADYGDYKAANEALIKQRVQNEMEASTEAFEEWLKGTGKEEVL